MWCIIIQWNTTQPQERRKSSIYDNMDRQWGYYAKWNKQRKTDTAWYHLYVESLGEKKKALNVNSYVEKRMGNNTYT